MDILFYVICSVIVCAVSWAWVQGIDYMHTHHPDYKGEDFDGDESSSKKEEWDDNKQHTEQDFK